MRKIVDPGWTNIESASATERRPQEAQKPLKTEKQSDGRTAIIWLIVRIRSEDLGSKNRDERRL
jgi:hypothetical protein